MRERTWLLLILLSVTLGVCLVCSMGDSRCSVSDAPMVDGLLECEVR